MKKRPTISAMYYVKNEEEFAPYSIQSIYNAVDEIVVVDNGSTDRTREQLTLYDKVRWFQYETTDLSKLANFAKSQCQGDWILKVDGDEVFYPDVDEVLPVLVEYDQIDAYTCRFFHLKFSWDHMKNVDESDVRFQRIFLFRNRPQVSFINAIHESLVGIGPVIADSGLHYVHYGIAKPIKVVMEKLRDYARRMGEPYFYEGRSEKDFQEQSERRPFPFEHPEAIKAYIAQKGYRGGKPIPKKEINQLKQDLNQFVASIEGRISQEQKNKPRSLEIACLPNSVSPGFEHMDIRPISHVDIVGDIRGIPLADNRYDQIIVPGFLMEHLPYSDLGKALQECFRITKEGGKVYIRIYDACLIAAAYAKGEINNESFNRLMFGDDRQGWERHRCMLDKNVFRQMMEKAGFQVDLEFRHHWMIEIGGTKPWREGEWISEANFPKT